MQENRPERSSLRRAPWGVGISFVGMVHATKDRATRLAMLQRSRGARIAGQFLAAAATAAVPVGFVRFAHVLGPGPWREQAADALKTRKTRHYVPVRAGVGARRVCGGRGLGLAHPEQFGGLIDLRQPGGSAHRDAHGVGDNGRQPAVVGR